MNVDEKEHFRFFALELLALTKKHIENTRNARLMLAKSCSSNSYFKNDFQQQVNGMNMCLECIDDLMKDFERGKQD